MQPNMSQYLPPDYTPSPNNGKGSKSIVIIVLAIVVILFAGLAIWGFMKYFDLNENFEQQVSTRVEQAKKEQKAQDQAEFEEIQKSPFRTYTAPGFVGQLTLKYPKSWSFYVEENESGRKQLDGIVHPGIVAAGSLNEDLHYAFRFELRSELYDKAIDNYERRIESQSVTARAMQVDGILSTRIEGQLERDRNGTVVLIPIRDKTLFLFNENPQYLKDFNKILNRAEISP